MGWCAPLILSMNWDFPSPASVSQCEISGKTATFQMDDDGYITLLLPGEEIAQRIYDRHKLLTQVFIQLGVSRRQRRLPPPTVPGEHDGSPGCPSREAAGSRLLPLAAGDRRYRPRRTARRQRPDTNGNTDPAGNRNPVPPPEWHSGRPQRQSGRFR